MVNYLGFKNVKSIVWDRMQGLVEIDERILNIFDIDFRHINIVTMYKSALQYGKYL